ncbi:unnamed protein product [Closterium sp. NIES-64]|nr:unnamed protein product [Closterium sp. NIES-64]
MEMVGGMTLKVLVDAMLANPDGYYGSFATPAFELGAARGQFQSDPLPPLKDKKGGKDGGKNGGGRMAGRMAEARLMAIGSALLSPTGVVIKKGADVALTVTTSDAKWTNRTLSNAERAKLGDKLTPKGRKGKQPPPPPPPPLGYNYETTGTWLSTSTVTADNGQTYKELADAMLAAPDAYSALIYTKAFENGAASGAFANVTKAGGERSGKLGVKLGIEARLGLA